MADPIPEYLVDDHEEPSTIWVPGHLVTPAERAEALGKIVAEWEGLVELLDLLESSTDRIAAAAAPLVWMRPERLSDEDRRAAEDWYGGEVESWETCEAEAKDAVPWTALHVDPILSQSDLLPLGET